MTRQYYLQKITTETYVATCAKCNKPFRSDNIEKVKSKVTNHFRDKHVRAA